MADASLSGVVVGGAISLTSTLVATFGMELVKQRREARNLAYAFHGGIGAILTILAERKYVDLMRANIASARAGNTIRPLKIRAQRNYLELYSKNVERLGILNQALAQRIPVFYTCVNSLLEDVDSLYEGDFDELSQADLLSIYQGFLDLLVKTINLGNHIVALVAEKYPPNLFWLILPG